MRWRSVGRWWLLTIVAGWCAAPNASARWARPQLLYRTDAFLTSAALAENARGDAVAAWTDAGVLHVTIAPRGRPFGTITVIRGPQVIADNGVGAAIDDRGRAIVAVFDGADAESGSTPLGGVVVVRGAVDRRWSKPETVSLPGEQPTSGGGDGGPIVAIRGGRSAVGWDAAGGGPGNTSVRIVEGSWGHQFGLPVEPALSPDAAILGLTVTVGGAVEVVWTQETAAGGQAFVASGQHGRFGAPAPILATPATTDYNVPAPGALGPFAGLDDRGDVRLLWDANAALYRPGGAPVPWQDLAGGADALAVSPNGHALAVWTEIDTNLSGLAPPTPLRLASAQPGAPFGAAHRARGPSCSALDPSLALGVSDTGRGVIVGTCDNVDQVGNQPPTGPAVVSIPIDAHGRPGREHVLVKVGAQDFALASADGRGRATAFWLTGAGFHAARELG